MNIVYPNIEAERARKQMSQEELSNHLGVERKSYYNWLTNCNTRSHWYDIFKTTKNSENVLRD